MRVRGGIRGGGEAEGGRGRGQGRARGRARGRGRDRGRGRGGGRGRERPEAGEAQRRGPNLSDEIRATLVDHVVNHGLTLREAGLRVQPNISRFTVASVAKRDRYVTWF